MQPEKRVFFQIEGSGYENDWGGWACPTLFPLSILVIARAQPVAIHCEPGSETFCLNASIACSGLPRRTIVLLAMTKWVHCESVPVFSWREHGPWRSTVSWEAKRFV
jgi:hypothetical protein